MQSARGREIVWNSAADGSGGLRGVQNLLLGFTEMDAAQTTRRLNDLRHRARR